MSKRSYAGIPEDLASYEKAAVILQSIPYDGTSTWGKGADKGFDAFCFASENMELYDIETDSEPYLHGVYMPEPLAVKNVTPEEMGRMSYEAAKAHIASGKLPTFFGGEHSISIGIIRAFAEKYPDLTVLQIDAHTDLRQEYMGTKYNHACAVAEAQRIANLIQVGIRSMDVGELEYLDRSKCYFAHDIQGTDYWMEESIKKMTDNVYVTFDLDAFDSSIMPSTGTPEPGGMLWYETIEYLRRVFSRKNIVGFDIVELAPNEHNQAPDFVAAKLYYKMLSYYFKKD